MKHHHEHHSVPAHAGCHSSGGSGHGMGHGSAKEYLRRFGIVTALLVPLIFTNEAITHFLGVGLLPGARWVGFGIATVIFSFALVFFQHAWHEIKARQYGMMTLVSLAVGAGYLFSVASTFLPSLHTGFYLEISTLIWVLLFGHYLEARSGAAAGNALEEVAKLLPKQAHRLTDAGTEDVDVGELREGDSVLVKPGEKIPADGTITEGTANIDESLISGESKPVEKQTGQEVVAGSICLDSSLTVTVTRVGEHSTVGQIQMLISEAQRTKPRSQRIADRASAVLTFVAGSIAILTLIVWAGFLGEPFVFGMTLAITVLVIACPHALGLAIPTVTTITTSLAVKNGVFIKDLSKIEVIKRADYVVFDKTGTLTEGKFGVQNVVAAEKAQYDEKAVIGIAASLEVHSSHVIGQAIVRYGEKAHASQKKVSEVKNVAGKGMTAQIDGTLYAVGNRALMHDLRVADEEMEKRAHKLSDRGETVVYVAGEGHIIGLISLSDAVKPESHDAVNRLHELGVKVAMLTGDTKDVARGVAEELGIDTYMAEVLPEDKYVHVKRLQDKGNVVLMVGDGVNDAPALTQADVGIAIGAGTDVAVEAGDVVLTRNSPYDIPRLVVLARSVYRKMLQNLVWALGYNVLAIPAAAGVFAAWGFFLRPEVGALLMSFSTVIVVVNALALKRIDLS